MSRYKIVFMGTPDFAVPVLEALADDGRYDVVGVFCQPDRPAGRGKKLTPCPVKQLALKRGLEVFQFERIRRPEGVAQLRALAPDAVITAAFGQILTQELLDIPAFGTINVHASLLPGYRGPAPINWCIANGETVTGVTIMRTDIGIDTGDMYVSAQTDIGETESAGELSARLSGMGAKLLVDSLPGILSGDIRPVPQDPAKASYQPMLNKAMGAIDWTLPARTVACRVRGFDPWPGAYTDMPEGRLKVCLARAVEADGDARPGTVIASGAKEGLTVRCGEGALQILELQAPGGRRMAAKAYLAGKKIEVGTVFGESGE